MLNKILFAFHFFSFFLVFESHFPDRSGGEPFSVLFIISVFKNYNYRRKVNNNQGVCQITQKESRNLTILRLL